MTDSTEADRSSAAVTAGAMLRKARQAQGLHIAALAASIKVAQRKLELLETDQFDQLPDATFTRALAQTVCRALKIDAAPVLALLPPPSGYRLEHVGEGLNAPFRDRPGRMAPKEWGLLGNPVLWLVAALAVATAVIYLMPAHWLQLPNRLSATPSGRAASAVSEAASTVSETIVAAPITQSAASSAIDSLPPTGAAPIVDSTARDAAQTAEAPAEPASPPITGVLQLRPSGQSWVEVTDARGQILISRMLEPGEAVGLDGALPLKVRVGNASTTEVLFRGQPVQLAPYTRDNVARMNLK
jgi:cytoskeleton protein RodZ